MDSQADLVPIDTEEDCGLTTTQVRALEMLSYMGAEPAPPGPARDENGVSKYHSDPKIRMYQLLAEGRAGGKREGAGRRPRKKRAAEAIADHIRDRLQTKMQQALERALDEEAGVRANLDAVKLAVDIERGERALQIKEEEHDELGDNKEEILGKLFELVGEPAIAAAIEGTEAEEITDAEIIEDGTDDERSSVIEENGHNGDSSSASANGGNGRVTRQNGRKAATRNRSKATNSVTQAALRRAKHR
jgi:hypothetical protein